MFSSFNTAFLYSNVKLHSTINRGNNYHNVSCCDVYMQEKLN